MSKPKTWQHIPKDLSDEEWDLISDLVPTYSGGGKMGRPAKWSKRHIVDAILYVAATGCQWRALPSNYPHWNTVHRYHRTWSQDGTWERIVDRLRRLAREQESRDPEATASVIDARSVQGASTVGASTRGYDAGKKVSGRKVFGLVDTMRLLIATVVVPANYSDNAGGMTTVDRATSKTSSLSKVWHDAGFKKTFAKHCRKAGIDSEVVKRISPNSFEVIPRRWVVERTWGWLTNHRRLRIDHERDPTTTEGFIWAAHARQLLRRLTKPNTNPARSTN